MDKKKILNEIMDNLHQFNGELEIIDSSVLIRKTSLDFLCVDSSGRLVLIECGIQENDTLIFKAIDHYDWILSNMDILKKKYVSGNIDYTLAPEVIIVSQKFSDVFLSRVAYLNKVKIYLYTYVWDKESESMKITPLIFKVEQKKAEQSFKSPQQIMHTIKNSEVKNKCRKYIEQIEKLKDNLKIDTSECIIKFLHNGKYFAGIYPFENFFWINFNPEYWQAVKVNENSEINLKLLSEI